MKRTASAQDPFDFQRFAAVCVSLIARDCDYVTYDGAFMSIVDQLFPAPAEGRLRDDPDLRRRMGHCLARAIWKATPHPGHRYAIAPLPRDERNTPCHCGSGRKYKHCCEELERVLPLRDVDLTEQLLEALPGTRWHELAGSHVDPERVANAVGEWQEAGRSADIVHLLEPWFAADDAFVARREALFDSLLDAYSDLDKPRKKAALLERARQHGDATIRAAALQRRVCMASDDGDYAEAWRLFAEAQRAQPDSPSLAHLEITVLISEGRHAEARERARFWITRLARRRDADYEPLIEFLRNVAERGADAMIDVAASSDPVFDEFLQAWRAAPPIASLYTLQPDGESAGPLRPKPVLAKALAEWDECCPPLGYSPIEQNMREIVIASIHAWLPLLKERPELWNAFEVLDAVATAAHDFNYAGVDVAVAMPILERGERMLREVQKANAAEGLRLEWGWRENRPALSLLGSRIAAGASAPVTPQDVERLEWLVLTLNPNDNHGFRDVLLRRYLEAGRLENALALAERYPDDFAAMRYNRVLALFAAGRSGAAVSALRDAAAKYPKPLAWLLKPNPKPPRQGSRGVVVGGDEEAWLYRNETLPLWEKLGALDWLRSTAAALRPARSAPRAKSK